MYLVFFTNVASDIPRLYRIRNEQLGLTLQIGSGITGYKLDGSILSKEEAEQRIRDGSFNSMLGFQAYQLGKLAEGITLKSNVKQETQSNNDEGASGAIERINAENLKYSNSAWYENRPYQKSPITIQNIIDSCPPGADPKGSAGLWWKVDGVFNGSQGTYELLISPDKTRIWHFLFRTK